MFDNIHKMKLIFNLFNIMLKVLICNSIVISIKTTASSSHHQVLLHLFIYSVKGGVSVDHDQLGLFVFPGPDLVLVCTDVFVTQAQRPQGIVGKVLQQQEQSDASSPKTFQ